MNVHSVARRAENDEPSFADVRRTLLSTDKRTAILEAAVALFVERGFYGTAVPAIAERAGVGAGTIYRYFASKEVLVNVLYREWKEQLAERCLAVFAPELTPREEFHLLWTALVGFVKEHPTAYAFLELHHHSSYLDEQSVALENRLFQFATDYIAGVQKKGGFRTGDPAILWSLIEGAFIGLVRSVSRGRTDFSAPNVEAAEAACWTLIAP